MNKKAFTLVELLAIIIVMGVILTIAIPAVNKIIKNSQLKTFEENERKLGHAVDVYFSNHYYPMPKNINDSLFVSLKELKANKIVEDVYDPKDNSLCDEIRSGVTITKVTANKYDYIPYLKCTNFTSSTDNNIVESISHTYNSGTGKYSINVKVTENPNNLWDFVTDTYKIGYIKPTLLNYTQWVVGTSGSQGTFGQNGSTAENQIILYPNPWGKQDVVWATLTNDATSNADGGWSTSNYTIDKTKNIV